VRSQGAFVTVQFVAVVALTLVLFVMLANVLVWSYGRGVVRAALDEGVRAGARAADPVAECQVRAQAVLADLLGGAMGTQVEPVRCADRGDRVVATTTARFKGWLPVVPDWTVQARALATREVWP
jgi:hypothetical protein